jgi:hypothetical protein
VLRVFEPALAQRLANPSALGRLTRPAPAAPATDTGTVRHLALVVNDAPIEQPPGAIELGIDPEAPLTLTPTLTLDRPSVRPAEVLTSLAAPIAGGFRSAVDRVRSLRFRRDRMVLRLLVLATLLAPLLVGIGMAIATQLVGT